VRSISRFLFAALTAASLAACQSTASVENGAGPVDTSVKTASTPAVEFPQLTCTKYGKPLGNDARLTASRVKKGDPYYIEFRYRKSYAIISGHMYDVFGRLDADGNVLTRQYIGLFPSGSILGLYGGAIVPVPGELLPSSRDCGYAPGAAYRVSLTADQYQRLLAKVREALAHPPLWHMEAYNCNHFAAGLGSVAGLKLPEESLLPSFAYIHAFIKANGDKEVSG
jgi:hypothetical protein